MRARPTLIVLLVGMASATSIGYGQTNQGAEPASEPDQVTQLIATLKDKESSVRSSAINELGKVKDPRSVEPLIAT